MQYGKQCCKESSGAHSKVFRPICGKGADGGNKSAHDGGLWKLEHVLPLLKHKTLTFPGDSMSDQLFMGLYFELKEIDEGVHWLKGERATDLAKTSPIRQRSAMSNGTIPMRLFRTGDRLNISVSHHSLHLKKMWDYGVDSVTLRNIMDAADITVFNYGLKWHREHESRLVDACSKLVGIIARANQENAPKKLALVRETLPQHFPTPQRDGDFEGLMKSTNEACTTIAPKDRGWRNEILHRAARANGGFNELEWLLPQWKLFVDRPEVHARSVDCTHLCYSPRVFDALLDPFFRAVHRRFAAAFGPSVEVAVG